MLPSPIKAKDIRIELRPLGSQKETKKEGIEDVLKLSSQKGFRRSLAKTIIFWSLSILTGGLFWLLCYWFRKRSTELLHSPCKYSEAEFVMAEHIDGSWEFCPVEELDVLTQDLKRDANIEFTAAKVADIPLQNRIIVWRHTRLLYSNDATGFDFIPLPSDAISQITNKSMGLTTSEAERRLKQFGNAVIDVPIPHWLILLLRECLSPFFIFQLYSFVIWMTELYYSFSCIILGVALFAALLSLYELRKNLLGIKNLARVIVPVTVLRNGKFIGITSDTLVPGDVVVVTTSEALPCDLVLLTGQAVCNESMLTGESTVVIKTPPHDSDEKIPDRSTLFTGTKVVEMRVKKGETALAMVTRTGFSTLKGRLILSILFPKPAPFKFYQEAVKFVVTLFVFALGGMGLTLWQMTIQDSELGLLVQRTLDAVTIVVPPTLPLAVTVGISYALVSLKKHRIFCISPPRVSVAGKVNFCLFDKTGTLTNDGLDLRVIRQSVNGSFIEETSDKSKVNDLVMNLLSTCHTLTYVKKELTGDPLEVKAFSFTGSTLEEPQTTPNFDARFVCGARFSDKRSVFLGVLRQFEFTPALQRMSVLVHSSSTNQVYSFVKGSPEVIKDLATPQSIPRDYDQVLSMYANQGYRVLACGFREYPLNIQTGSVPEFQIRSDSERGIHFLGFLVFENLLKPESAPTISTLKNEAGIRVAMATGDNPLTASSVAKNCGIVDKDCEVYMSEIILDGNGGLSLRWVNTENPLLLLNPISLVSLNSKSARRRRYTLAMTAKAFNLLEADYKSPAPRYPFEKILMNTSIFARMAPEDKGSLIERLNSLGLYTLMCGDGANDVLALRAAHVGVSLSTAEASVAAPFSSLKQDIACVPVLLQEGRASLHTSFQLFKFLALYSFIQFTTAIIIVFQVSFLSNSQYLWQDFVLVFFLALTLGRTAAEKKLSFKRPSGRLFSFSNLLSTFSHIAIVIAFQITLFNKLYSEEWYDSSYSTPTEDDPLATNSKTPSVATLFLLGSLQDLAVAILFGLGGRYKRWIITNWMFILWWIGGLVCSLCILFAPTSILPDSGLNAAFDLYILPQSWKLEILLWAVYYTIAAFGFELSLRGIKYIFGPWFKRLRKVQEKPYQVHLASWRRDGAIA